MINPEDMREWLAQIEIEPASAPDIARLALARLGQLEEANETLRNATIALKQQLDTRAHEKEIGELRRQVETLARLVRARSKKHAPTQALLAWAASGYALAFNLDVCELDEMSLAKYAFRLPAEMPLHLLAAPLAEDALFLTNQGQAGVFKVEDLVKVTQEAAGWHKIPDLALGSGEVIVAMTPIGELPLSHSLVTASRGGYTRSLLRWSMERFLQEGQLGRGAKDDKDCQACAGLCLEAGSDVVLFTQSGQYLRFPESDLSPSLMCGLKLDKGDRLAGMTLDNRRGSEVLMVGSDGRGSRRALASFQRKSAGLKPQPACTTADLAGVRAVSQHERVAVLMKNGKLALFDAEQAPLIQRAGVLSPLPGVTSGVRAFTSFPIF